MISAYLVLWLLFSHWVADFLLQTDDMAKNKSSDCIVLGFHCIFYSIVMTFCFLIFYITAQLYYPLEFFIIRPDFPAEYLTFFLFGTFVFHFAIDYVTSRMTTEFWIREERHWFFVTIGFDQFLHFASIIFLITVPLKEML